MYRESITIFTIYHDLFLLNHKLINSGVGGEESVNTRDELYNNIANNYELSNKFFFVFDS